MNKITEERDSNRVNNDKKKREIFVCKLVANEINRREGTDYSAIACGPDPPDDALSKRFRQVCNS